MESMTVSAHDVNVFQSYRLRLVSIARLLLSWRACHSSIATLLLRLSQP